MDKLFDQSDVADLEDKELEPVTDEQWEQAVAAAEQAGPALDAEALRRAGEEERDEEDEDEEGAEDDEEAAAAAEGADCADECAGECEGADEAAGDCPCADDHACRGNDARPGSCCLLNAPAADPAAVLDEAVAQVAAQDQLVAMAAAAVAQDQLAAAAALAGEFAPVASSAVNDRVEGGQDLSVAP